MEDGFTQTETTSIYDTVTTTYTKGQWRAVLYEYNDGSATWLKTGPDVRTVFETEEIPLLRACSIDETEDVDHLPDSDKLKAELAAWVQTGGV